MANTLWSDIVTNGKKNQSHPQVNVLDENDVNSILATADFFGANQGLMAQIYRDLLGPARFRLFDALAMYVQSGDDDIHNQQAIKVLCHAFIKAGYNEKKFIKELQVNDYEINREWEKLELTYY